MGGMGAVFLLRDESNGQQQALKLMLETGSLNPKDKELFLREIENTRALRHPNIVRLIATGSSGDAPFFTMEYCDGGSAWDLATGSVGESVEIVLQVLTALEFAHHAEVTARLKDGSLETVRGIVHRDLKPPNILISGSGTGRVVKVADFGLSKAFEAAGLSGVTAKGDVGGTVAFMPRQQFEDYVGAQPEVNVWAAAASLYWLLTDELPRQPGPGQTWGQVIKQMRPTPVRDHNGSVPAPIAEVIDAALDDSGTLKYQSAAALAAALKDAVARSGASS